RASLAQFHNCLVANRAPSAIAANFSHATLGWVSLNLRAEAAKPQSAPAITFSPAPTAARSVEHTSELQSPYDHVCRLLLEKKNKVGLLEIAQKITAQNGARTQAHRRSVAVDYVIKTDVLGVIGRQS